MYCADYSVRLSSNYCESIHFLSFFIFPPAAEPRHGKGLSVFELYPVGNLFSCRSAPFIKAISQDKTPPLVKKAPECRFFLEGFSPGIDEVEANFRVFSPVRNEAPHVQMHLVGIVHGDNDQLLSRSSIIAGEYWVKLNIEGKIPIGFLSSKK